MSANTLRNKTMQSSTKIVAALLISATVTSGTISPAIAQEQTIETRIGKLTFTHDFANGYPTKETVKKLYDERDFQRAVQAYIWSLPMVSNGQVRNVLMVSWSSDSCAASSRA